MLLANSAFALTIDIYVKDSFGLDERIQYNYTLISDNDLNVTYTPHVTCPNAPATFLEEEIANLKAGQPYSDIFYFLIVEDYIEPQTCTAYVEILSPVEQREEKSFQIDTSPSFNFEVNTCKDQTCTEKAKVFLLNENIYLDYDSSVEDPSITATLEYPDKTTEQIALPASITASQIGTYSIQVSASKSGYKTIVVTEQFGVIGQELDIASTPTASSTDTELSEDTMPPVDTTPPTEPEGKLVYYLLGVGIIVLLLMIYYFSKKQ